jgi:hypothetical protein
MRLRWAGTEGNLQQTGVDDVPGPGFRRSVDGAWLLGYLPGWPICRATGFGQSAEQWVFSAFAMKSCWRMQSSCCAGAMISTQRRSERRENLVRRLRFVFPGSMEKRSRIFVASFLHSLLVRHFLNRAGRGEAIVREFIAKRAGRKADSGAEAPAPQG